MTLVAGHFSAHRQLALAALWSLLLGMAWVRALPEPAAATTAGAPCPAPVGIGGDHFHAAHVSCAPWTQDGVVPLQGAQRLMLGLRVDLNTATAADLSALPGVGDKTALRMVESRERVGPFERVEDITRVKGIGPATLKRLTPWLEVALPGPAVAPAP